MIVPTDCFLGGKNEFRVPSATDFLHLHRFFFKAAHPSQKTSFYKSPPDSLVSSSCSTSSRERGKKILLSSPSVCLRGLSGKKFSLRLFFLSRWTNPSYSLSSQALLYFYVPLPEHYFLLHAYLCLHSHETLGYSQLSTSALL